jgi:hypothetical protein
VFHSGDDGVERRLAELASLAGRMGWADMAARLSLATLDAAPWRIVVVGEAGTGKTSLINRAFLQRDRLPTGGGTAVPVEIQHARERSMAIYPYLERPAHHSDAAVGAATVAPALLTCAGPPATIPDPAPSDIQRHISAAGPGKCHGLSGATERVRLFLPEPALKGRILVDTPGIHPLGRAAVAIRYRIIPVCDRVVFLTRRRRPIRTERLLLESPLMAGLDCRRLPPGAAWTDRQEAIAPAPPAPGCRQRARRVLAHQTALAWARWSAEKRLLEMPPEMRRKIRVELEGMAAEIRKAQARRLSALEGDLADLAARLSDARGHNIAVTVARHGPGMRETGVAPSRLCRHLESIAAACGDEMAGGLRALAERYDAEGRKLLSPWEAAVRRHLGRGAAPDAPAFSVQAMAEIDEARLNPFAILADILPGIIHPAPARPAHWRRGIDSDIAHRVEAMFRPAAEILPSAWADDMNSRMGAVQQSISAADERAGDPERREMLAAVQKALSPPGHGTLRVSERRREPPNRRAL